MTALRSGRLRVRARVRGTVQGVGFRPFVYRLAHEESLGGYVLNDQHGVLLEVEGSVERIERFMARLVGELPPLATVDEITAETLPTAGDADFRIAASSARGTPDALVTVDSATCADCLRELFDPADRRYRYPFTNCTNCGPRFTIVRGVPYDRPLTTMAGFSMCEACRGEYEDPADRRFHAQPNACPVCGPRVSLLAASDRRDLGGGEDPLRRAARRLAEGAILAVKGLGGYHLACDARDAGAVAALRARKHREDKPFALMVRDVEAARGLCALGPAEERLLLAPARPIVLAPRRFEANVADAVAPGAPELGCMLAYTPLHHLLLAELAEASGREPVLVMTSGNVSDEPIAYRDPDALERLAPIADAFLVHDRPIQTRTDDSVVRVVAGAAGPDSARLAVLRRARGYVPARLGLPIACGRPLLACGAEQKNTFCVAKDSHAWVSHHIGDLEHEATLRAFREGIEHFERLFAVAPEVVAYDLHPGYLSTSYALERDGAAHVGIQHHHAHLAACLAEHGVDAPALGLIFDGTGYGTDGTVWGGELLVGDLREFERVGSLRPVRMPGGTAAIRQPWRMAYAWAAATGGDDAGETNEASGTSAGETGAGGTRAGETGAGGSGAGIPPIPVHLRGRVDETRWRAMAGVTASDAVSPVTTSMGRLFDAVGALCGVRAEISYEGQAAVELEALAAMGGRVGAPAYELELAIAGDSLVLDPRSLLRAVIADLDAGAAPADVAAGFHGAVARGAVAAACRVASERGLGTVVLSGGVFQNRRLLEGTAAALTRAGLRVLVPERLPVNDGGISYGQAAIAAAVTASPSAVTANPSGVP